MVVVLHVVVRFACYLFIIQVYFIVRFLFCFSHCVNVLSLLFGLIIAVCSLFIHNFHSLLAVRCVNHKWNSNNTININHIRVIWMLYTEDPCKWNCWEFNVVSQKGTKNGYGMWWDGSDGLIWCCCWWVVGREGGSHTLTQLASHFLLCFVFILYILYYISLCLGVPNERSLKCIDTKRTTLSGRNCARAGGRGATDNGNNGSCS